MVAAVVAEVDPCEVVEGVETETVTVNGHIKISRCKEEEAIVCADDSLAHKQRACTFFQNAKISLHPFLTCHVQVLIFYTTYS